MLTSLTKERNFIDLLKGPTFVQPGRGRTLVKWNVVAQKSFSLAQNGLVYGVLMPLSTIFQLYHGC
jgi:hypothetical protein